MTEKKLSINEYKKSKAESKYLLHPTLLWI